MSNVRFVDSNRLDVKKLAEMWKNLSEAERDVCCMIVYMYIHVCTL